MWYKSNKTATVKTPTIFTEITISKGINCCQFSVRKVSHNYNISCPTAHLPHVKDKLIWGSHYGEDMFLMSLLFTRLKGLIVNNNFLKK